jgi:hypothetical protein
MVNRVTQYVDKDGRPTLAWLEESAKKDARIEALEAVVTAFAAVAKPSGGATVDAEARTAVDALIDAANS